MIRKSIKRGGYAMRWSTSNAERDHISELKDVFYRDGVPFQVVEARLRNKTRVIGVYQAHVIQNNASMPNMRYRGEVSLRTLEQPAENVRLDLLEIEAVQIVEDQRVLNAFKHAGIFVLERA